MRTRTLAVAATAFIAISVQTMRPAHALDQTKSPTGTDHNRAHVLATGDGIDIGILEAGGLVDNANAARANVAGRLVRSVNFTTAPASPDEHSMLVTAVAAGHHPTHVGVANAADVSVAQTGDWNNFRSAVDNFAFTHDIRVLNASRFFLDSELAQMTAIQSQNGRTFDFSPGQFAPLTDPAAGATQPFDFAAQTRPRRIHSVALTTTFRDGDTGVGDFDAGDVYAQVGSTTFDTTPDALLFNGFPDGTSTNRRNFTDLTPAHSDAILNDLRTVQANGRDNQIAVNVIRDAGANIAAADFDLIDTTTGLPVNVNRIEFPNVNAELELLWDNDDGANQKARFIDWVVMERDLIFTKSSGNNGDTSQMITAPGDAFNGITVGATDDSFKRVSWYSSSRLETGAANPAERGKPDLVAPGGSGRVAGDDIEQRDGGTDLISLFGTSFAAPHVAGTAALVLDYADDPGRFFLAPARDPAVAAALAPSDTDHRVVKTVILNSANKDVLDFDVDRSGIQHLDVDFRAGADFMNPTDRWVPSEWRVSGGVFSAIHPLDDEQGTGSLNTLNALLQYAAGEQNGGTPADPAAVPVRGWDVGSVGETATEFVYQIRQPLTQGSLTATLAWDRIQVEQNAVGGTVGRVDAGDRYVDPTTPGGAAGDAVRDFDLKIYRNGLDQANLIAQSVSDGENVEHIYLPELTAGTYYIEVETLAGRPQDFALAWWTQASQRQQTGAVSFSVDGGTLNPLRPPGTAQPAEGIENVFNPANPPNDVYVLGMAPPIGPAPGGLQLPSEGEIFVSGTGSFDVDPDGTNIDRLSGALGNVPRVGPHQPAPVVPPATGDGVLGLVPGDNINALSYGKDSGNVLFFSVDPESTGVVGTDVHFQSTLSPGPLPLPILPTPLNPGGGDPGDEAAGDIFASQRFEAFGSYNRQHLAFGKKAPLVAEPGDNLLLYDESELGLQAPALNGAAIGAPEDDLDALEMSDPSDPIWGVDFNTDGVLQPWEDPVWFSLDWFSPSIGLASQPFGGDIPLFTPTLDTSVSADDILMTPPGFGEDVNGNGVLDAGEDFDGDGLLDAFTFGIYASGLDMGLLMDDNIDALVLSDEGLFGLLDPGLDEALFSLAAGSPTLAAFGFSAADVFRTDFSGNFWLYAGHGALGLLFDDELNALDIRPAPLAAPLYLMLIALVGLRAVRRSPGTNRGPFSRT